MPYSYNETEASGDTDLVNVPFGYINESHVHVYLDGEEVTQGDLSWLSANSIQLPSTPAAGVTVKVQRVTPLSTPLVTFSPSILNARHLNLMSTWLLFIVQEAVDEAARIQELGDTLQEAADQAQQIAADTAQLISDTQDAINDISSGLLAAKDTAVDAAATAVGAASAAEGFANSIDPQAIQDALDAKANSAELAEVATSGSYNDLADTPSLPSFASQEEAEAGEDNSKMMTPLRTKEAVEALSLFTEEYVSDPQSCVASGGVTLNHGLSGTPKLVTAHLVCKTAQQSWEVGDILDITPFSFTSDTLTSYMGMVVSPGPSAIIVRYGATLRSLSKASAGQLLPWANWELVVRAYR